MLEFLSNIPWWVWTSGVVGPVLYIGLWFYSAGLVEKLIKNNSIVSREIDAALLKIAVFLGPIPVLSLIAVAIAVTVVITVVVIYYALLESIAGVIKYILGLLKKLHKLGKGDD